VKKKPAAKPNPPRRPRLPRARSRPPRARQRPPTTPPFFTANLGALNQSVSTLKPSTGSSPLPLTLAFVVCPFYLYENTCTTDPISTGPDFLEAQITRALDDIYKSSGPFPLALPEIQANTRILLIHDRGWQTVPPAQAPQFAVLCRISGSPARIEASRTRVVTFCAQYGIVPDASIIFSGAPSSIPTGWFGTDSPSRGGVPFTFDSLTALHAAHSQLPGVVAVSRRPLAPFQTRHELLHALSSYNNGQILDEYDASAPFPDIDFGSPAGFAVNKRPISSPSDFTATHATYNNVPFPGELVTSRGLRFSVPRPLPNTNCIMRSSTGRPAPDSLIMQFMTDRLTARIRRTT